MAVSSLLTSIEDMEGSPTILDPGSGPGGSTNTDVFIEANQSVGRRVDNATGKGVGVSVTAVDLSAASVHAKIWVNVLQWPSVTQLVFRLGDGTNNDDHVLPTAEFPPLGGFIPLWLDVSRTPETGGSANEAAITDYAIVLNIGNVGGTSPNLLIDEVSHGTSGLRWTGTGPGDMADFRTFEDTNREGNLITLSGIDFCYSRLEIGNAATESDFTDSGFTLVFPDQPLVEATFMGVTIVCGNASSVISITNATFQSSNPTGATNRPDLLVTGTSGTCTLDTCNILGMRIVDFTSAVAATNCLFNRCGAIDLTSEGTNGADISGSSVLNSIVAANTSALIWNVNADPDGELDDLTIAKGAAAHHAIEFGANVPATMTIRNCDFTGFDTTTANPANTNDAHFHFLDTGGTITLNLIGCTAGGTNFTYRTAGATIILVEDPVTVSIHVDDNTGTALSGAQVGLWAADGTGIFPFEETVSITRAASTATVTHTAHGMQTGDYVVIGKGVDQVEYSGIHQITVTGANTYTYTVGGSPASPATGTIVATGGFLAGTTNGTGDISVSRVVGTDTPVKGFVRKSTSSPRFKTFSLLGNTVDNVNGLSVNIRMILDE